MVKKLGTLLTGNLVIVGTDVIDTDVPGSRILRVYIENLEHEDCIGLTLEIPAELAQFYDLDQL